ncbi:outer membrane beta-barrel family protein [Chitinophaga sancti]|uniref:outer membrane beta-barrel family protein n=1 Tax=Chitinophaga sancti TaxID=1004 RepID=UPI002A753B73|nr:outer membrane beta-barrel family protein [Chitinophaga sancti]WPQ60416.1 outer membrane beta-barrel family protein [Chitinophaga sancti]
MNAQNAPGQGSVKGIVLDANNHAGAAFVAIRIREADGTVVKVGVSGPDGKFLVKGINKTGNYVVTFSAMNYQAKSVDFQFKDSSVPEVVMDTVYLEPQHVQLKEVGIVAGKPIVKQKAGMISYDMQADPDSKSSNVLMMVRKIPYLSLDANENITLKGNADFKVLINGKSSGMFEHDLKNILKTMPASSIARIDVYTIPPARFDAEGAGGIINIVTIPKVKDEYKGTISISENGPVGGPGAGGSFTLKKNQFGFSTFMGGNFFNNPTTDNVTARTTLEETPKILTQSSKEKGNGRTGYVGVELSYEIDSLKLVTGKFNSNDNHQENNKYFESRQTTGGTPSQEYNLANSVNNSSNGMDAGIDYQITGRKNSGRRLTFSYKYSTSNGYMENSGDISDTLNFNMADYMQKNDQQTREHTAQVDYEYPKNNLTIEAGVKGIFRDNKSEYKYYAYDDSSKGFELQSDLSDLFNYNQTVLAAYNSYIYNLKSWNFQGGLRMEKTSIAANFLGETKKVKQDYVNFFPSVSINKGFKNNHSLNIGFTQRMKRPGINRLNPFVDRQDPGFVFTGNPGLKPVIVNSVSAGYNIPGKINFTGVADYTWLCKVDLPITTYDSLTNITTSTFANTGNIKGLSAFVYAAYNVTGHFSTNVNGSVIYFWIDGLENGTIIKNELLTYAVNLSLSYSFTHGWRARADGNLLSKNPTGFQGTSNGLLATSFGLSKDLLNGKLTVDAGINNPFNKYRDSRTYTTGTNFYQTSNNRVYYRLVMLTVNYNFGKMTGNIKKSKTTIRNNDLSNGKGM